MIYSNYKIMFNLFIFFYMLIDVKCLGDMLYPYWESTLHSLIGFFIYTDTQLLVWSLRIQKVVEN